MSWDLIWEHLFMVLYASLLAVAAGLPLGIIAYLFPKARKIILRVVDILQTIPSLALLGIIMVFMGAGKLTVILGIALYSQLPIVSNTCLGLQEVPSGIKESAEGMGMSRMYRLLHVELPFAFPMVFTGIRIAMINAIGSAVFAAYVGGGGLGSVITTGIQFRDLELILLGTGALIVIAIVLDLIMGYFENALKKGGKKKKRALPIMAGIMAIMLTASAFFGLNFQSGNGLTIFNGNFGEIRVMHYMIKLLVEEKTELDVTIMGDMTSVNMWKAITNSTPEGDLFLSYDGTMLTTFLKQDTVDVPEDMTIYEYVNEQSMEQYNIRLLDQIGFDNTYAIGVRVDIAEKYDLETISDLAAVSSEINFGAEHEFFSLEGSMKFEPMREFYGIEFKKSVPMDKTLKYTAVENGSIDATIVYATDGLNRKVGLKVLEDDRDFFPEYNGSVLIRQDILDKYEDTVPELEDVLNLLGGTIDSETMTDLTYKIDVMGEAVEVVAKEYLQEIGLID